MWQGAVGNGCGALETERGEGEDKERAARVGEKGAIGCGGVGRGHGAGEGTGARRGVKRWKRGGLVYGGKALAGQAPARRVWGICGWESCVFLGSIKVALLVQGQMR